MVRTSSSRAASLTGKTFTMSSSSNSSPSCPGHLDSQPFHHVFPAALPHHQCNILYVSILQQPSLVIELERQSSYEEDNSICSLIRIFHHLCSTQIYLGSYEPHTDHVASTTLHIIAALDDTMDLLHDHGFHHHVLTLPPNNITLTHIFRPIYRTMTAPEHDAYEESDLRSSPCLSSEPYHLLPVLSLEIPVWAQNRQRLQWIIVFNATSQGIFVSTVRSTSVPTAANVPRAIPNIVATVTTVLFAVTSATSPAIVQTTFAPSATTQATSLLIAPS